MGILVLNTLYLKGEWRHQFPQTATNVEEFFVSPTTPKMVPFIKVIQNFYYAESTTLDAKILRIPYLVRYYYFVISYPICLSIFIVFNDDSILTSLILQLLKVALRLCDRVTRNNTTLNVCYNALNKADQHSAVRCIPCRTICIEILFSS